MTEKKDNTLDCVVPRGVGAGIPILEGITWSQRQTQQPASPTRHEALLPFGIRPRAVGEVQPDGTRLVRYAMQEGEQTDSSRLLGSHTVTPPNALQQQAMHEAMRAAEQVANVRFQPAKPGETPHLVVAGVNYNDPNKQWGGHFDPKTGTVTMSNSAYGGSVLSAENKRTALHELGHALGLEHPRRYVSEASSTNRCELPAAQDRNNRSTVMSYDDTARLLVNFAPMDIAALQALHGRPRNNQARVDIEAANIPYKGIVTISDRVHQQAALHVSANNFTAQIDLAARTGVVGLSQVSVEGSPISAVHVRGNIGLNQLTTRLEGGTVLSSEGNYNNYIIHGAGNQVHDVGKGVIIRMHPQAQVRAEVSASPNTITSIIPEGGRIARVEQQPTEDGRRNITLTNERGEQYRLNVSAALRVTPSGDGKELWLRGEEPAPATARTLTPAAPAPAAMPPGVSAPLRPQTTIAIGLRNLPSNSIEDKSLPHITELGLRRDIVPPTRPETGAAGQHTGEPAALPTPPVRRQGHQPPQAPTR